jgi:hypothetical protein
MSVLMIASAAYLSAEFTAEFGRLPPAFIPVGNRPLWHWQLDRMAPSAPSRVLLSIPADFELDAEDEIAFAARNIELIRVPLGMSLGESLLYCITVSRIGAADLQLLFGDTLVRSEFDEQSDVVGVASTAEYYAWSTFDTQRDESFSEGLPTGGTPRDVVCGYFRFTDPTLLAEMLMRSRGGFIAALNGYHAERPLSQKRISDWLDFGHLQLYFQSKSRMTTQRAFNNLNADSLSIQKSSADSRKMDAEAGWFEDVPDRVKLFAPQLLGRSHDEQGKTTGYRLEYLYLSTLSELFVFGRLPLFGWSRIFAQCDEFLSLLARHQSEAVPTGRVDYFGKSIARLEAFTQASGIDPHAEGRFNGVPVPSLMRVLEIIDQAIADPTPENNGIIHGDFCFSNVLFDFRSNRIRVIDPRGLTFAGERSIHGDRRYDLAKLSHSVIGRYDQIIAGRFRLVQNGDLDFTLALPESRRLTDLEAEYRSSTIGGMRAGGTEDLAMVVMLFISMLPLHADSPLRQMAFLANAYRLFLLMERDN